MAFIVLFTIVSVMGCKQAMAMDASQVAKTIHDNKGKQDLQKLLSKADLDQLVIDDGVTPLFAAAKWGSLNSVKALIEMGANPNVRMSAACCTGWTALNIAAAEHKTDVVAFLLKHGADPNIPNQKGRTPLMFASHYGFMDIAKLLIAAKADLNLKTTAGGPTTAVLASAYRSHKDMTDLLIKNGAQVDVEDCKSVYPATCGMVALALEKNGRVAEAKTLFGYVCEKEGKRSPESCRRAK